MSVIDDIENAFIAFVFLFIIFRLLLVIYKYTESAYSAVSAGFASLRGASLLSVTISMKEMMSASIKF